MTDVLQVGKWTIAVEEFLPLLASYQMLPQLKRELIIDQAIAAISCTSKEIQSHRQFFFQQQRISCEADLQAWMGYHDVNPQQLDLILARQVKLEKFKQLTWESKLDAYFLTRKAQFDKVVYSLLRVKDMGAAHEFYFRLQAGEQTFAELAREYSKGPEAQTGGRVGPVELSTLHTALAKMLSTSQPGKLLPPVRLGEWYVIVRLEEFLSAELNHAIRQRLLNDLLSEWIQEQLHQLNAESLNSVISAVA